MFIKDKNNHCLLFLKKEAESTLYLIVKFLEKSSNSQQCRLGKADLPSCLEISRSVDFIRKLKQLPAGETFNYKVLVAFLKERQTVELTNT